MKKLMTILAVCSILLFASSSYAQSEDTKKEGDTESVQVSTSSSPLLQGTDPVLPPDYALTIEKKQVYDFPDVLTGIEKKEFKKRLPPNYKALKLTSEQTIKVYAVQEQYHDVIFQLQSRLARLQEERNKAYLAVLTADQQEALQKKNAPNEKVAEEK